ncbi:para-nitrobenzyl esterase [Nocardioides albertanoniae]|uniref:Carboxylic ester hydrolase n=1 Tax=Nocardioides albertanoniae TaxID=1175486 RepID=A0A543AAK2_9ACTN|nr:carboxylesterase family protein [Nocardioides albertanoniae]TQL69628.1 para-nitrobenzyl esterase [Nocardioides albertanoniae]
MTRVAAGLVLLLGLLVSGPAAADPSPRHGSPVLRHTSLGPVQGLDERRGSGTYSWLGIPYAAPPVDDLRWQATRTHRPWREVRRTQEYGPGCAQPGRMFSPSPDGPHYDLDVRDGLGQAVGEEDCLTLNVFRPATKQKDLPVIVFVHGGSNVVGYSADPMYDGRTLARRANAVVVTVNYRLGVFGWFDHPGLKTGDPLTDSGDFALLDQIESLRFVQRNATAFGGNPRNVSVMGESAGAVNVWALMVSPLTTGLMHRAIPLSGGLVTTPRETAQAYAAQVGAAAVEDSGGSGEEADVLRSMPADELVRVTLRHRIDAIQQVVADGTVIPTDAYGAIAAGRYRDVPILAGNTFEEGKLFGTAIGAHRPTDYERFTMQYEFDPDAPAGLGVDDLISDAYLPVDGPGGWNEASEALTRSVFLGIIEQSMSTVVAAGNDRAFYYELGWNEEPAPFDQVYGSVHAIDLPFVFGNFGRSFYSFAFGRANESGRLDLSTKLIGSISAFIRTGDPGHARLGTRWEQWPKSMVLDATKRRAWTCAGTFGGQGGAAAADDAALACDG